MTVRPILRLQSAARLAYLSPSTITMVKATEKRIYLTRHAQAEHKYVFCPTSWLYADVMSQCGGRLQQSVPSTFDDDEAS